MATNKQHKEVELPPWATPEFKEANKGEYKMHRPYMQLLAESTFYAALARYVRFQPTFRDDVMTAGVRYDVRLNEFVLEFNPFFMKWIEKTEGLAGSVFVLRHELSHIFLGHTTARARDPHLPWNLATDTIINLMCSQVGKIPDWVIFPGRISKKPDGTDYPLDEISPATKIIASWNPKEDHCSEWYFNELMKGAPEDFAQQMIVIQSDGQPASGQSGKGCKGPQGSFDSHDWDVTMSSNESDGQDEKNGAGAGSGMDAEDFQEFLAEKARELVEKAVNEADKSANGWGNMPSDMQSQIRRMVSKQVDWKTLLRQFVGKSIRGGRTVSIKRINRKYPYIHPGLKRGYVAKLVAMIDQSGSVGDSAVEMFFGELHNLTRMMEIDVYPFDTRVEEKDCIRWKRGAPTPTQRAYCGGTDFSAPTQFANDTKNRGRWDGLIILTDGLAPKPCPSRMKRAWILAPGCKLEFTPEPGETVIMMDNDGKREFGAWK